MEGDDLGLQCLSQDWFSKSTGEKNKSHYIQFSKCKD